jgi:hypothetical protein
MFPQHLYQFLVLDDLLGSDAGYPSTDPYQIEVFNHSQFAQDLIQPFIGNEQWIASGYQHISDIFNIFKVRLSDFILFSLCQVDYFLIF